MEHLDEHYEVVKKLSKDLKEAAKLMGKAEVRYLVDSYYAMQRDRIRLANQERDLVKQKEPSTMIPWLTEQSSVVEKDIRKALKNWVENQGAVADWLLSITGIAEVLASGLLAHIDIEKASTAGKIWRFAGLDPTVKWEKKKKRPWNASLKTLCWKIGESFVKVSGNTKDVYGKLYVQRKELEQQRNEAGLFKEEALKRAADVGKDTDAYKSYSIGKFPPAHIHSRAKRYAVKIFLSHLHHVMYLNHYKTQPPKPWVIEHGGHVDIIEPPNMSVL